jgi:hypothetical protein
LIKKDLTRYFGVFKEGEMNGRFYSRNLQGEVYKQKYTCGKLEKEERELKFNNFFEILKLEHLDYKNLFETTRLFQRESQSNFDNLSLQRKISIQRKISQISGKDEKTRRFFSQKFPSSKPFSMNVLEPNVNPRTSGRRVRKSSLVLDRVFLEDKTKEIDEFPEINWSPSDEEDSKNEVVSIKKVSKSGSKRQQKLKEQNLSVTVKRYFHEDSKNIYEESSSFYDKKTKKDYEYENQKEFEYGSNRNQFKSKFKFFEEKFKNKKKNNKESFFKNLFLGFLDKKQMENQENVDLGECHSILSGEQTEDDEDSDALGDSDEPPNLDTRPIKSSSQKKKDKAKKSAENRLVPYIDPQEHLYIENFSEQNEQDWKVQEVLKAETSPEYYMVDSFKRHNTNQFNSICLNSITVNGFVKEVNSVETDKLNVSISQLGAGEEEKAQFKKKETLEEKRESVLNDLKVINNGKVIKRLCPRN